MYMESWTASRAKPVRMASSPYSPVALLMRSAMEIISAPVWRDMRPRKVWTKVSYRPSSKWADVGAGTSE